MTEIEWSTFWLSVASDTADSGRRKSCEEIYFSFQTIFKYQIFKLRQSSGHMGAEQVCPNIVEKI